MHEMNIYKYLEDFPYHIVEIAQPDKRMLKIAVENIDLDKMKAFSSIKSFVNVIEDSLLLCQLFKKTSNPSIKQYIKSSPYWKDDANLIIEVIDEK